MAESRDTDTLRWLGQIALGDGVIAALVGLFGRSQGWSTPAQFGLALLVVGIAILAFGVFSLRSQKLRDDDPRPLVEQRRRYGTGQTIAHHNRLDRPQARSLMVTLGATSLPLLALGLLLRFLM